MNRKDKIKAFLSDDSQVEKNDSWNKDFWANVSEEQKFSAAWDLVKTAWEVKGRDAGELRLKRTVGLFKPA
jgi:hypothetical protein